MTHYESYDSPPYFHHFLAPTNYPIYKVILINQVLVDSILHTNYLTLTPFIAGPIERCKPLMGLRVEVKAVFKKELNKAAVIGGDRSGLRREVYIHGYVENLHALVFTGFFVVFGVDCPIIGIFPFKVILSI
jgi:hypothetical protein